MTVPTAGSVTALRRQFYRGRNDGARPVELLTVWGGGVASMLGLALWVVSGRATGFTFDPVLSVSVAAGVGMVVAALALHGLRYVGPIGVDTATMHWVISTPVDRRALLRGRVLTWTAASIVGGVVVARSLSVVAGTASWWPLAVLGASRGAVGVGLAVLGQSSRLWARVLPVLEGATIVGAVAVGRAGLPPESSVLLVTVVAAAVWVAAVVRSGRVRRASLTSSSSLLAAGSAGLSFADVGFVVAAVERRAFLRRGAVRSRRLPSHPVRALVVSDVLRHTRHRMLPGVASIGVGLVVVASAALPLFWAGVVAMIVGYPVVSVASSGLRDIMADNAMRRTLALPDHMLIHAFLVVPASVSLLYAVVTGIVLSLSTGVVVGAVSLFAVYRSRTGPPLVYDGLAVVSMFGTVPVDVIRQLLRGPGIVLLGVLALLLV